MIQREKVPLLLWGITVVLAAFACFVVSVLPVDRFQLAENQAFRVVLGLTGFIVGLYLVAVVFFFFAYTLRVRFVRAVAACISLVTLSAVTGAWAIPFSNLLVKSSTFVVDFTASDASWVSVTALLSGFASLCYLCAKIASFPEAAEHN